MHSRHLLDSQACTMECGGGESLPTLPRQRDPVTSSTPHTYGVLYSATKTALSLVL